MTDQTCHRSAVYSTAAGTACAGDSAEVLMGLPAGCARAVITSPPFALTRQKDYGNPPADEYSAWIARFVDPFKHVLAEDGSLCLEMGGAYLPGAPVKSIYQFEALVSLVRDHGFRLAQDFYWHNPARLPSPAQWVNVERSRVKDSVSAVWWLSLSERPLADNRRVLNPYSSSQMRLMAKGADKDTVRPSGHEITAGLAKDNGGSIPPNLLQIPNTASRGKYLDACREAGKKPHPARWPIQVPEFFIKFLSEPGDLIIDPFAGSNTTGAAAERNGRRWLSADIDEEYVTDSAGWFDDVRWHRNKPTEETTATAR